MLAAESAKTIISAFRYKITCYEVICPAETPECTAQFYCRLSTLTYAYSYCVSLTNKEQMCITYFEYKIFCRIMNFPDRLLITACTKTQRRLYIQRV